MFINQIKISILGTPATQYSISRMSRLDRTNKRQTFRMSRNPQHSNRSEYEASYM